MAVTKTHPIKSTLKAAIDYICNPEKTDGKLLVSSYGCAAETADIEFSWTRHHAIDKGTNLGRHLIQAFQPGEVTPEQAHEIGMELAKEILGGKYEFVLTTHIDKDHVHNHLIFNAVSFANHKHYHSNKRSYHYMVLNPEPHCVELVYAGQNVAVTETVTSFENERQKVEISLVKSIEQNEHFGIGTNGEMKNISFGLFAAEEIVSASGTSIPANGLVEIISLNEDGTAKVKTDLPFGSYYVQELATDSHYMLSDTKYPVTFWYAGQDTAVVKIAVNDGNAVENKLIYGSVSGKKADEDGNALGGALIGLFRTDDGEFTKENALMTTTSAEDGSFSFESIPYGTWYVREIEQPAGFVLDDTIYPVTIGADGQVVEIKIVNRYVRGDIHLTKVDSEYPDNKLTGATFEVYKDSNANGKLDSGDELLGTLSEKEKGEYSMNDLFHGRYFVKETKAPEGFVLDTGVYEVMIDTNGKTYEVENKAGVGFINEAMRGNLKIVKTSSDGKVKGFAFRITGANGYDIILETNDKGEIFIDGLRIGDYTISEVSNSASSMYVLPADKKATVKLGSTTIVEMHNVLRDTPKTGDTTNLPLLYALAGLSAVGIAMCCVIGFKKKKKEDRN